jgi:hypothetical protein
MLPQLLLLVASALDASAHMALHYPPPLKAEHNPHTRGRPDKAQHYPHGCCDQQTMAPFPCRGHLNLLDTPEGDPVASWPAGSLQHWTMYAPRKWILMGERASTDILSALGQHPLWWKRPGWHVQRQRADLPRSRIVLGSVILLDNNFLTS